MTAHQKGRAILLDRDGTLIVEKNYLADPSGVELMMDAPRALQRLTTHGYSIVIISNQSGVGRGILRADDVAAVNDRIAQVLAAEGVSISAWYHCPHHPDDGCNCRKPMPGLAIRASIDLDLDLTRCWMIGDKASDIQFAAAIGAQGILVQTGYGANALDWASENGFRSAAGLNDAADIILATEKAEVDVETF